MAASLVGGAPAVPPQDHVEPGTPARDTLSRLDGVFLRLCRPVDIASLVVFRIAFGAVMLWEVYRHFSNGWIRFHYIQPTFHFKYFLFEWVNPWPGNWMYLHFWILAVLAVCIMTGALYRGAAFFFFLGISYMFLLDQATYLNHMYLVCVISFLMIFVPCHRLFSVDAWNTPSLRSNLAPTWALWLLRFQIAVPYTYGGIAKLNSDWLQGEPVRMWLAYRAQSSSVAPILTSEWMTYLISYGGLLFDLAIVPLLLWPRTRPLAFVAAVAFHLTNWYLFNIGIFPWLMMAATLLFFPPSWPRNLARVVRRRLPGRFAASARPAPSTAPAPGVAAAESQPDLERRMPGRLEKVVIGVLVLHVAFQMLMPFRHLLYPGDVAWTEEGHRFAWRMKLRDKAHTDTYIAFIPSTKAMWTLEPRDYIAKWQLDEMDGRPDMILQLAKLMATRLREQGYQDAEVYVRSLTALNGRPRRDLIDTTVNLASKERSIWPADWLLPLDVPLKR